MNPRFAAVLLMFCGFTVTDAGARPRTMPDRVISIEEQAVTLERTGRITLSGLWLDPAAPLPLAPGQRVEVKAQPTDRYGRTPVLIFEVGGKDPLQKQLLADGSAMLYGPMAAPAAWRKAEAGAKATKRGLWSEAALKPDQMGEHMGEVARVKGSVTRTYKSRSMHYINFGEDWRTDFSLRIPRRAWRAFGKEFTVADGACIEARGAVFDDNGPMIEITRPEQMEIVHANACAG